MKDMFSYKAVFFDLDGTLIDSAKDLSFAINSMTQELGLKQPSLQNMKNWIGNGTLKLVERALEFNGISPRGNELNNAFKLFANTYRECVGEHSVLFPGAKKLLVKLLANNTKVACITNKPLEFTEFLLQQNMISQFFSIVCAGDNVEFKKPHKWPLVHASKMLGVPLGDCLMIGDSQHDIAAARNAGCDVVAVSYGYNHGEDIALAKPDAIIDDFNSLL